MSILHQTLLTEKESFEPLVVGKLSMLPFVPSRGRPQGAEDNSGPGGVVQPGFLFFIQRQPLTFRRFLFLRKTASFWSFLLSPLFLPYAGGGTYVPPA